MARELSKRADPQCLDPARLEPQWQAHGKQAAVEPAGLSPTCRDFVSPARLAGKQLGPFVQSWVIHREMNELAMAGRVEAKTSLPGIRAADGELNAGPVPRRANQDVGSPGL